MTTALRTIDDVLAHYETSNLEKNLLIGIELERSGIYRDSLEAVSYEGDNGYNAVFRKLIEEAGWQQTAGDDANIWEMTRGEARLTVEANGRPELAGSPREHLHELAREFRLHDNELREIGNIFNIAWVPMGLEPLHGNDALHIINKNRFRIFLEDDTSEIMQSYMKRSNGVHVNFSFTDAENAVAKVQTAFRILPVVTAMYACSPFDSGALSPYLDTRRYIAKQHPRCRYGVPETILDDDFSLHTWIEHYLDEPVILIANENGPEIHPKETFTFRDWMEQEKEGRYPTAYDFDQHIKTLWADIRLRNGYIEYRPCDTVRSKVAMSLPAFLKGLMFDSGNWEAVRELTRHWTYDDIIDADRRAWTTGLQTEVHGKTLLTYAQELITCSNEKLHEFGRTEASDDDESVHLAPLKEQIYIREKSFAEELRDLWQGEWNQNPARILEWCEEE